MSTARTRAVLAATAAMPIVLLLAATPASAKRRACDPARYLVVGEPLVAGASGATIDAVGVGPEMALGHVCPARAPRRLKANRKGVTVVRAKWRACDGLAGRVRLAGRIVDGCTRLRGKMKGRGFKRRFEALRSRCGDGVLDAASGETCDGSLLGGASCASLGHGEGALACRDDCRDYDTSACSTTCADGSPIPPGGCGPSITLETPAHGLFTRAPSVAVRGRIHDAGPDAELSVNGRPVAVGPDGRFGTDVALVPADVFNPILLTLTRPGDGRTATERVVVIAGDALLDGQHSPAGVVMRIEDRGLDRVEEALPGLFDVDLGALVPPGQPIVSDFCYLQAPVAGCVGAVAVTVSDSPRPRIGDFSIALDSQIGHVAGTVELRDLYLRLDVDAASGAPLSCWIDIAADAAEVRGFYDLEPSATAPARIDVRQQGDASVVLDDLSLVTNCAGPLSAALNGLLALVQDQVQELVMSALENHLNERDVRGDTPIAAALEEGLAGVDLAGTVGDGLGVRLDARYAAITEDPTGITLALDVSAVATPAPGAPNLTASYHIAEPFPVLTSLTPERGAPYGLGLSISASAVNQILRAVVENGILGFELAQANLGTGTVTLTAGLLTGFIPEFAALAPETPLALRLAPTLAPIVTGRPGPAGELIELRAAHLLAELVQTGAGPGGADTVWLGLAVDAVLGLDLGFDDARNLGFAVSTPAPGEIVLVPLENPLGADLAPLERLLPTVFGLALSELQGGLGNFPLPRFEGLVLRGVEVSRTGGYTSLFVDLQPPPGL